MSEAKSLAVQGRGRDGGVLELLSRRLSRLLEKVVGRRGVDGFVDRVLAGEVIGWAFDPKKPHRRVHIVARCEGRIVAEALADLPRKDLAQDGKGDGRHGFNLRLPASLLDGSARKVRIEVGQGPSRRLLRGGAITVTAKRPGGGAAPQPKSTVCHGVLESVSQGLVQGWAAHPRNGGTPAVVDVYDDERYLGSVTADRPRPGLKEAGAPSGALGFQFRLPPGFDPAGQPRLRARIAGTRIDLRRGEAFPGADNGRTGPLASAAPEPEPASPRRARPSRQAVLLIIGDAGEAEMRRAAKAWAAQSWPELAIGAVGDTGAAADGEHRFTPADEARLRDFLGEAHTVVLARPDAEIEPALARAVVLGRPLCDVLTWTAAPGGRREADRLATLLGETLGGAFAVRGGLLAAYPGPLARELAAGETGPLARWLAETPAARWGRLAGAASAQTAAPEAAAAPVAPPAPRRFSFAVWPQWTPASLASLEALAASAPADSEAEVLVPAGGPMDEIRTRLGEAGPQIRRITVRPVDVPSDAGAGQWLRALGEAATGEAVIFCRAGVRLPSEAGALAALGGWAMHSQAGAVGAPLAAAQASTPPLAGLALRAGKGGGWTAVSAFAPALDGRARPVLAVTGALMAIGRAALAEAGGFDAERFPDDGADLDLCLRLRRAGRTSVLLGGLTAAAPAGALAAPALEPLLGLFDPEELAAAADAYPAPSTSAPRRRAPDAGA